MKNFLDKQFLLESDTAQELYHNCAKKLPILDYHCHLSPKDIAEDRQFENLTKIWLEGDHYKWRAMRTLGIDEQFITGSASDLEKFKKWAYTVPFTLRNPLYHWTHLELKNYFGITELLNPDTADSIYRQTCENLQSKDFSVRNLLRKMKVEMVCTTDDPIDNLEYHQAIKNDDFEVRVLPTFRPDKAYAFENPESYNRYLNKLENATDQSISDVEGLLNALEIRMDYFDRHGCIISDHGLQKLFFDPATKADLDKWFGKLRQGKALNNSQVKGLKSYIMIELGKMYHNRGWIQQYHLGALRDTNDRMLKQAGPDSGFDSIGDLNIATELARFMNELDKTDQLTKTILYNLNPKDNAVFASMIGNFNDGSVRGKIQYGPAWWYLDQKDGIEEQINMLSNMSLLSCFIGMLTDSRSFLSYSRHEYFRRILCNLFGNDVENGEIPLNMDLLQKNIRDICYFNAKEYFNLNV